MIKERVLTPEGYALVAEHFRVLSEPVRLRILHHLRSGEMNVGELVTTLGISQPSISKHLRVLLEAELVSRRAEGTSAYFRVREPSVFVLCEVMCSSLEARMLSSAQRADRLFEAIGGVAEA